MADLSEEDLKFVLSVDPDEEALRQAIDQINAEVERAKVKKLKLGLEELAGRAGAGEVLPAHLIEKLGGNLEFLIQKQLEERQAAAEAESAAAAQKAEAERAEAEAAE